MRSSSASAGRAATAVVLLALATPLVRADGLLFPYVVPKAFFFQALVALSLVLLALATLRGEEEASSPGGPGPLADPFSLAFLVFVAASGLAAVMGEAPSRSLLGTLERRWGVLTWAAFLGFYLLLRAQLDGKGWRRALEVTSGVALAVALYGLARAAGWWPGQQAPVGWQRVSSTLGNAGYLAPYLTIGAVLSGYLALAAPKRWLRWTWLGAAGVQLAVVLLSGTRAIVAGAGVAAVVLAAAWTVFGSSRRLRWGAAALLVLGGGGAVAALLSAGSGDPLVLSWPDRLLSALSTETSSARFRLVAWGATIDAVGEAPLLGVGPENFDLVWSRHFEPVMYHVADAPVLDRAHSVLVGTAATTGLLGLAAYLALWAVLGRGLQLAWRRGALSGPEASVLAFGAIAYFVYLLFWFEDHSSFLAFVVLAGLVGHLASGGDAPHAGEAPPREDAGRAVADGAPSKDRSARRARWRGELRRVGVPLLLLALAGVLAWHNVRVLGAARNAWKGEYSLDAWEGVAPYRAALAPGLPGSERILRPYLRRLTYLAGHGDSGAPEGPTPRMEEALAAAERAVDDWEAREPRNAWAHVQRSRLCGIVEDVVGDGTGRACARRSLERAVGLSPRRIRFRHWLADHHLSAGDPDRALEVLDQALEVYGSFGETYYYRARVHWARDEVEEAVRQSRLATSLGWGGQPSPFVHELARRLAEEERFAEAARLVEDHLAIRYARLGDPGLETAPGRGFQPWDLQVAAHLPLLHLHAGDPDAAVRTAEFVAHRLARSDGPDERRERVARFIRDVRSGRTSGWEGSESVVEAAAASRPTPDRPEREAAGAEVAPTGEPG